MKKTARFVIWICSKFTHEQIQESAVFTLLMLLLHTIVFRFSPSRMFSYSVKCCRFYLYCILKKPVEQFTPMLRGSPVKSERIFIKVIIQLFVAYGTLMGSQKPSF